MRPWYRRYKPGWWAFNPGSGGGAATVQTDGVTIQGDGSAGNKIAIKAVQTNASLSGAGTVASPLGEKPLTFLRHGINIGGNARNGANQVSVSGIHVPVPLTFANILVFVDTVDAVNLYDIGIYSQAGALLANIGAQTLPTGNLQSFATLQGSQTIEPGLYLFAWTGNATTAQLRYDTGQHGGWVFNQDIAASVGGALPASIGAVAVAPNVNSWYMMLD